MRNEFAKCEIKTSVFSGRKPQAGNCCVEYDYVGKQSIPTTGLSPASPTALWAAELDLTPHQKKPDLRCWHHKNTVRWVRCIGRRTNPFSGTNPELQHLKERPAPPLALLDEGMSAGGPASGARPHPQRGPSGRFTALVRGRRAPVRPTAGSGDPRRSPNRDDRILSQDR